MITENVHHKKHELDDEQHGAIEHWVAEESRESGLGIGLVKITAGCALCALPVMSGSVTLGSGFEITDYVVAGTAGLGLGGMAGALIGGIGVAALGGAIGIPALAVAGASGALLSSLGVGSMALYDKIMHASPPVFEQFVGMGMMVLGAGLIISGVKDVLGSEAFRQLVAACGKAVSWVRNGVLYLVDVTEAVVKKGFDLVRHLLPRDAVDAVGSTAIAGGGATAGALAGGAIAASTTTVLGSTTLGGWALTLGIISAPVWPVYAVAAAGAAVGLAAWKIGEASSGR